MNLMLQLLKGVSRCSAAAAVCAVSLIAVPAADADTKTVVSGPPSGTVDTDMTAYFQRFNDFRPQATVVSDPHPAWTQIAGARYVNVTGAQVQEWGKFVYTKKLELPAGAVNATVSVDYLADDCATFSANNPTANDAVDASRQCNSSAGQFVTIQKATGALRAGINTLRFDLINHGSGANPSAVMFKAVATYEMDTDGDGILDGDDAFPLDKDESVDTDGDGTGNNADTDDDGDGVADTSDSHPLDARNNVPSSKEQCKQDGWKAFFVNSVGFKNQGDCVSYIATRTRNAPAGQ